MKVAGEVSDCMSAVLVLFDGNVQVHTGKHVVFETDYFPPGRDRGDQGVNGAFDCNLPIHF